MQAQRHSLQIQQADPHFPVAVTQISTNALIEKEREPIALKVFVAEQLWE
jgi:hypothetical protein